MVPTDEGGFVFMCNKKTEKEVFDRQLFGLPRKVFGSMQRDIGPGTLLFLLNFQTRVVIGVFRPRGKAQLNIVPEAWKNIGRQRFPAQVRFENYWPGWAFRPVHERDLSIRGLRKLKQGPLSPRLASELARQLIRHPVALSED